MTDGKQTNLTNPDLWIRLIYMIIFGLLSGLARWVIVVIAILQFLMVLLAREENRNLRELGDGIAEWTEQCFRFLCFGTEQKPYPFQEWPASPDVETPVSSDDEPSESDSAPKAPTTSEPIIVVPTEVPNVAGNVSDNEVSGSNNDEANRS